MSAANKTEDMSELDKAILADLLDPNKNLPSLDPDYPDAFKPYLSNDGDEVWDWTSAGEHTFEVARDMTLSGIDLVGAFVATQHATPGSAVARAYAPAELLKEIEVKLNGGQPIQLMSGLEATVLAQWEREGSPVDSAGITTAQAQTGGLAVSMRHVWHLDFSTFGLAPEQHGLIQAGQPFSITVRVKAGTASDLVNAATNNPTITGTIRLLRRGVTHHNRPARGFGLKRKVVQEFVPGGSFDAFPIKLSKGTSYERYLIIATKDATNDPSDACITGQVRVSLGSDPAYDVPVAATRAHNKEWFGATGYGTGILVVDHVRMQRLMSRRSAMSPLVASEKGGDVLVQLGNTVQTSNKIRIVPVENIGTKKAALIMGWPIEG